jgi:hypothetical protein
VMTTGPAALTLRRRSAEASDSCPPRMPGMMGAASFKRADNGLGTSGRRQIPRSRTRPSSPSWRWLRLLPSCQHQHALAVLARQPPLPGTTLYASSTPEGALFGSASDQDVSERRWRSYRVIAGADGWVADNRVPGRRWHGPGAGHRPQGGRCHARTYPPRQLRSAGGPSWRGCTPRRSAAPCACSARATRGGSTPTR